MGGSKSKQPPPSSKDGKARDPEVQRLLRQRSGGRAAVVKLIKKAATKPGG